MRKFTGNARLGTKCAGHERWPGVHGKLVNQVKETYIRTAVEATHGSCSHLPLAIPAVHT